MYVILKSQDCVSPYFLKIGLFCLFNYSRSYSRLGEGGEEESSYRNG